MQSSLPLSGFRQPIYATATSQKTEYETGNGEIKSFALKAFGSRLRWQSHFIQKFEMECSMEFESINKGYLQLEQAVNPKYVKAWETGHTGVPLVDAAMRCLVETGLP